jgi:hypothetical protein
MFPLTDRPPDSDSGLTIVSPCDLAYVEQWRALAAAGHDLGPTVPADIFVFALGQPPRRDVSKVGGLPYRPRGKPWPTTEGGPMTFLAQLRFTESRDLVGELPGDLLLIFTRDMSLYNGEPTCLAFEWYPLGLTDLARPGEVPPPERQFVTCYGLRHRTFDYLDEDRAMRYLRRAIPPGRSTGYGREFSLRLLCRLDGMKIGGAPRWFNLNDPERHKPGRFLATLAGVVPDPFAPFPWVNHPSPLPPSADGMESRLLFRDGGSIFLFLDEQGQLHPHVQFH